MATGLLLTILLPGCSLVSGVDLGPVCDAMPIALEAEAAAQREQTEARWAAAVASVERVSELAAASGSRKLAATAAEWLRRLRAASELRHDPSQQWPILAEWPLPSLQIMATCDAAGLGEDTPDARSSGEDYADLAGWLLVLVAGAAVVATRSRIPHAVVARLMLIGLVAGTLIVHVVLSLIEALLLPDAVEELYAIEIDAYRLLVANLLDGGQLLGALASAGVIGGTIGWIRGRRRREADDATTSQSDAPHVS